MSDDSQQRDSIGDDARAQEQAVQWFALMQSDACTQQDIADHQQWMESNLSHEREYRELEQMWELLGSYADRPEVIQERQHIRPPLNQQARQGNVRLQQEITQLQQKSNRLQQLSARLQQEAQKDWGNGQATSHAKHYSSARYALAASLVVVVLSGLVFQGGWFKNTWDQLFNGTVYQTGIGEQRTFYLSDGSSVILDTQTRVIANFSSDMRRVVLEHGQARFNVAKDKNRRFIVYAGRGATTAIGTAFVVRKSEENILVTLIEGKVSVTKLDDLAETGHSLEMAESRNSNTRDVPHSEIMLEEGQQVAYSDKGLSQARTVDVKRATSWQQGRLIFDNYTLREVVDELNRYSHKKIVLGDNALASMRVTGVFKSGDNRKAIQALKTYFSMRVTTDLQGNLVLSQKTVDTELE